MKYVYRDAERMARHPVHVPADPPPPEPEPLPPPAPKPSPPRPLPIKRPAPIKTPTVLPEPIWGGRLGLELARAEAMDWERRNPRYHHPERRDS